MSLYEIKKSIIINWDVWFGDYLDKRFKEPNHCINAYYSEIR